MDAYVNGLVKNATDSLRQDSAKKIYTEFANRSAENAKTVNKNDQIDQAATDFEAMFLTQMMSQMFAGVEVNGLTGGGYAEEVYRGLLVDEYGKTIAQSGGVGVADHVKQQLLRLQEATIK